MSIFIEFNIHMVMSYPVHAFHFLFSLFSPRIAVDLDKLFCVGHFIHFHNSFGCRCHRRCRVFRYFYGFSFYIGFSFDFRLLFTVAMYFRQIQKVFFFCNRTLWFHHENSSFHSNRSCIVCFMSFTFTFSSLKWINGKWELKLYAFFRQHKTN